jgi:hypothetical protein
MLHHLSKGPGGVEIEYTYPRSLSPSSTTYII